MGGGGTAAAYDHASEVGRLAQPIRGVRHAPLEQVRPCAMLSNAVTQQDLRKKLKHVECWPPYNKFFKQDNLRDVLP